MRFSGGAKITIAIPVATWVLASMVFARAVLLDLG